MAQGTRLAPEAARSGGTRQSQRLYRFERSGRAALETLNAPVRSDATSWLLPALRRGIGAYGAATPAARDKGVGHTSTYLTTEEWK
jgi:hypothetical protein